MGYTAVIAASVMVLFLGFSTECTARNIVHVQQGREPNAGASIFPGIPFVPALAVAVAWLLNGWYPNLGVWTVLTLSCLYVPFWAYTQRKLNAELHSLTATEDSTLRDQRPSDIQ